MFQPPYTVTDLYSIHRDGDEPELIIDVPEAPEEFRVFTRVVWSFREKPWPIGRFCAFPIIGGIVLPDPIIDVEIIKSGVQHHDLGNWSPFFPKGVGMRFVLSGGGYKHFIIQIR